MSPVVNAHNGCSVYCQGGLLLLFYSFFLLFVCFVVFFLIPGWWAWQKLLAVGSALTPLHIWQEHTDADLSLRMNAKCLTSTPLQLSERARVSVSFSVFSIRLFGRLRGSLVRSDSVKFLDWFASNSHSCTGNVDAAWNKQASGKKKSEGVRQHQRNLANSWSVFHSWAVI